MKIIDSNAHHTDRRRKVRVALSWTVYVSRPGAARILEATTKNISSTGLYCVVPEPFIVGELVRCVLVIPTYDPDAPHRTLSLHCQAKIVRVEFVGNGLYGVACDIESYNVIPAEAHSTPRAAVASADVPINV